jgi:hypothetical protein
MRGRDIAGVAVHAAARVMAQCQSSEVLVSGVVTDLVAGAGLKFSERGSHVLKGIAPLGFLPTDHSDSLEIYRKLPVRRKAAPKRKTKGSWGCAEIIGDMFI